MLVKVYFTVGIIGIILFLVDSFLETLITNISATTKFKFRLISAAMSCFLISGIYLYKYPDSAIISVIIALISIAVFEFLLLAIKKSSEEDEDKFDLSDLVGKEANLIKEIPNGVGETGELEIDINGDTRIFVCASSTCKKISSRVIIDEVGENDVLMVSKISKSKKGS